ncbi:unnamed protein product [Urochloa humidicola]
MRNPGGRPSQCVVLACVSGGASFPRPTPAAWARRWRLQGRLVIPICAILRVGWMYAKKIDRTRTIYTNQTYHF